MPQNWSQWTGLERREGILAEPLQIEKQQNHLILKHIKTYKQNQLQESVDERNLSKEQEEFIEIEKINDNANVNVSLSQGPDNIARIPTKSGNMLIQYNADVNVSHSQGSENRARIFTKSGNMPIQYDANVNSSLSQGTPSRSRIPTHSENMQIQRCRQDSESSTYSGLSSSSYESGANGLSVWYDNIRKDPGQLLRHSSTTSSMSVSYSSPRPTVEYIFTLNEIEDNFAKEEDKAEIWIEEKEEILKLFRNWVNQISTKHGNPFNKYETIEKSPINSRLAMRTDPYHSFQWSTSEAYDCQWEGSLDSKGRFHGKGLVRFSDGGEIGGSWKNGVKDGKCRTISPKDGITLLVGEYVGGKLTGPGCVIYESEEQIEGHFRDGCLHGLARRLDPLKQLTWWGRYSCGSPSGVCWTFFPGGGCLMGEVEAGSKVMTGSDMVYIFPDWSTCLVGSFQDGLLVTARQSQIDAVCLQEGIMRVKTKESDGPELRREISSPEHICSDLMFRDPYESRMVKVKESEVEMGGEGLYANRDLPPETVVAFYNGVRVPAELGDTGISWDDCSYRIFVLVDSNNNEDTERMDIPVELRSLDQYCATLAHKVNHSFDPNCRFANFEHPRFGKIPCVVTTEFIPEGSELFIYYHYLLSDCPKWYSDLWEDK